MSQICMPCKEYILNSFKDMCINMYDVWIKFTYWIYNKKCILRKPDRDITTVECFSVKTKSPKNTCIILITTASGETNIHFHAEKAVLLESSASNTSRSVHFSLCLCAVVSPVVPAELKRQKKKGIVFLNHQHNKKENI